MEQAGETSNCGNPHNTFLTLVLRMGVPTSLLYFGALVVAILTGLRHAWSVRLDNASGLYLVLLLLSLVSMLAYAFMSLFFESPFLSAPYWTVFGFLYACTFPQAHAVTEQPQPQLAGLPEKQPTS